MESRLQGCVDHLTGTAGVAADHHLTFADQLAGGAGQVECEVCVQFEVGHPTHTVGAEESLTVFQHHLSPARRLTPE